MERLSHNPIVNPMGPYFGLSGQPEKPNDLGSKSSFKSGVCHFKERLLFFLEGLYVLLVRYIQYTCVRYTLTGFLLLI